MHRPHEAAARGFFRGTHCVSWVVVGRYQYLVLIEDIQNLSGQHDGTCNACCCTLWLRLARPIKPHFPNFLGRYMYPGAPKGYNPPFFNVYRCAAHPIPILSRSTTVGCPRNVCARSRGAMRQRMAPASHTEENAERFSNIEVQQHRKVTRGPTTKNSHPASEFVLPVWRRYACPREPRRRTCAIRPTAAAAAEALASPGIFGCKRRLLTAGFRS